MGTLFPASYLRSPRRPGTLRGTALARLPFCAVILRVASTHLACVYVTMPLWCRPWSVIYVLGFSPLHSSFSLLLPHFFTAWLLARGLRALASRGFFFFFFFAFWQLFLDKQQSLRCTVLAIASKVSPWTNITWEMAVRRHLVWLRVCMCFSIVYLTYTSLKCVKMCVCVSVTSWRLSAVTLGHMCSQLGPIRRL